LLRKVLGFFSCPGAQASVAPYQLKNPSSHREPGLFLF
jgi:hypothetical protein